MKHIDLVSAESFLFHARGEIEFFPNTPGEELTLETEAGPEVTRATKMGNPLRITFKP